MPDHGMPNRPAQPYANVVDLSLSSLEILEQILPNTERTWALFLLSERHDDILLQ